MSCTHLEFLVEEASMEAFLGAWLPRHLPATVGFDIRVFQGKADLLAKLEARLRAYAKWLPESSRIVVLLDRDDDDCLVLKATLEAIAHRVGLATKRSGSKRWRVLTCLAIEELEAWYFGDWDAVVDAYPRTPATVVNRAAFRVSDAIAGGTWEAFERVLGQAGYFGGGLEKIRVARDIGSRVRAERNRSSSFQNLVRALGAAVG